MPSLSVRCRYGPIRPCSVGVVEVTVSLMRPTALVTASGVRRGLPQQVIDLGHLGGVVTGLLDTHAGSCLEDGP